MFLFKSFMRVLHFKIKTCQYRWLILLSIILFSSCAVDDDPFNSLLTKEKGSNVAAIQLLELLKNKENGVQNLQKITEPYEPFWDNTSLHMSSEYGMNFVVPYGNTVTHQVYGMVRYPVDYSSLGNNRVHIGKKLSPPMKVDAHLLNDSVDIRKRYLYSSYFKLLCDSTINKSDSTLTEYTSLGDHLRDITGDNLLSYSSPMDFAQFYNKNHIVISVMYNSTYIGEDHSAIYGLNPNTLMTVVRQCLLNLQVSEYDFDIIHNGLQTLKIGVVTENLRYPTDWFVSYLIQQTVDILLIQDFHVVMQYTYDEYLRNDPNPYPTPGGGSYTGGSSPGGDTGSNPSIDSIASTKPYTEIEEKCDSIHNADSIKAMTRALVDSCLNVVPYSDSIANVRWKDFTDSIANDPTIEYGASLNDYGDNGFHLMTINRGTSNNVIIDNISNATTAGIIHYHPNGTPPSARDLLSIVKLGKESNKIQASMVYTRDSVFYSLQITDRSKLAAFYNKIKNEVDSTTNDFKKDGIFYNIISRSNSAYKGLDDEKKRITKLSILLIDLDAGVQIVKTDIKKTINNVEIYSVIKNEKKYKPIKCL